MKVKVSFFTLVIFFTAVLMLVTVGASSALANGGYSVNWWTIDNGGGTTQSGDGQYTLSGTIGQWDAGAATAGGEATLTGGFWAMLTSILDEFLIYLPFIGR